MARENQHLLLFGRAVRRCRLENGLSQEALAARANLHFTYISSIERGERNIGLLAILRLARALKIPASELLGRMNRKSSGGSLKQARAPKSRKRR